MSLPSWEGARGRGGPGENCPHTVRVLRLHTEVSLFTASRILAQLLNKLTKPPTIKAEIESSRDDCEYNFDPAY